MTINKNKKELVQRSFTFEVRAEENETRGNIITGKPIVYDSVTDLGFCFEVIEKGALSEADLTDVRFLVNHDISRIPLARSRNNNENSTMQLIVDDTGMNIRVDLDIENNAEARALYSAVQRGDVTGMSFMFSINDYEIENADTEKPTHIIKSIGTVVEVSAVTFPAYESTEINARNNRGLESLKEVLESTKRAKDIKPLESGVKLSKELRALNRIYN